MIDLFNNISDSLLISKVALLQNQVDSLQQVLNRTNYLIGWIPTFQTLGLLVVLMIVIFAGGFLSWKWINYYIKKKLEDLEKKIYENINKSLFEINNNLFESNFTNQMTFFTDFKRRKHINAACYFLLNMISSLTLYIIRHKDYSFDRIYVLMDLLDKFKSLIRESSFIKIKSLNDLLIKYTNSSDILLSINNENLYSLKEKFIEVKKMFNERIKEAEGKEGEG